MIFLAMHEFQLSRRSVLILFLGTVWLLGETPVITTAQELPPVNRDIPWRRDVGAGRLTEPGRSRLLPPDGDNRTNLAQRQTTPVSAQRRVDNPGNNEGAPPATAENWWNEEAEAPRVSPGANPQSRSVSPKGEIIKSSQILSTVGSEPILAADMLGRINELLAPYADQATEEQMESQRWMLMQRMMPSLIEAKLVYLDFQRTLEQEQLVQIRSNIYKTFDEKQLPELLKQAKLNSITELDARLRSFGSSLDSTRRSFFEQVAAREMIRRETDQDEEITHDELLEYYREHQDEYSFPAKVRWEQLSAHFSDHPTKQDAYRQAAKMGNMVLRGAPLEVVAKKESDAFNAKEGGKHDWTTKGALVSDVIDNALFTMPVNQLSRIIEDDRGFHIVRVKERTDAGYVSFKEAQVEIRDEIKTQKRDERVKEYLERLKRETYVWNHFEEQAAQTANESNSAELRR